MSPNWIPPTALNYTARTAPNNSTTVYQRISSQKLTYPSSLLTNCELMQQARTEQLPKLQDNPRLTKAAACPKAQHSPSNSCTTRKRGTQYEEVPVGVEQRRRKKVQRPTRKFEDSDFAYVEQELPPDLFRAFKSTFLGKPVPEQTLSEDRLRELGGEGPKEQLWLHYCIERQLAYW